jgi:hypothetical protein
MNHIRFAHILDRPGSSASRVPDDILRVNLVVPETHGLIVLLTVRRPRTRRHTHRRKDRFVRCSWCRWIVRRATPVLMHLCCLVDGTHRHVAVQSAMLAIRVDLRGIPAGLAHSICGVRSRAIQTIHISHVLIKSRSGEYLGHGEISPMPEPKLIDLSVQDPRASEIRRMQPLRHDMSVMAHSLM